MISKMRINWCGWLAKSFDCLQLTQSMMFAGSASSRESEHPMISKCGVYLTRAEPKPFIEGSTNERQMQLMTVDGVTYKTIVRCWFTRCFYDQPRPSLKPRQSTGNGPYIDVRVMVAKIKNPDLNDDDHWRDLNINFSALDDGTRLTLFKFYFNRFGSQGANLTRMSMQNEFSMDLFAISVYSMIALVNLRHRLFHGRWRSKLARSKNEMSLALVLLATPTSNLTSVAREHFRLRSTDDWYAHLN